MTNRIVKISKCFNAWYSGAITRSVIVSSIADKMAGYHISHSATELLKDIGVLTKKGNINKLGKLILAEQIHDLHHHGCDGIEIEVPNEK